MPLVANSLKEHLDLIWEGREIKVLDVHYGNWSDELREKCPDGPKMWVFLQAQYRSFSHTAASPLLYNWRRLLTNSFGDCWMIAAFVPEDRGGKRRRLEAPSSSSSQSSEEAGPRPLAEEEPKWWNNFTEMRKKTVVELMKVHRKQLSGRIAYAVVQRNAPPKFPRRRLTAGGYEPLHFHGVWAVARHAAQKSGIPIDPYVVVNKNRADIAPRGTLKTDRLRSFFQGNELQIGFHAIVGQQISSDNSLFTNFLAYERDIALPLEVATLLARNFAGLESELVAASASTIMETLRALFCRRPPPPPPAPSRVDCARVASPKNQDTFYPKCGQALVKPFRSFRDVFVLTGGSGWQRGYQTFPRCLRLPAPASLLVRNDTGAGLRDTSEIEKQVRQILISGNAASQRGMSDKPSAGNEFGAIEKSKEFRLGRLYEERRAPSSFPVQCFVACAPFQFEGLNYHSFVRRGSLSSALASLEKSTARGLPMPLPANYTRPDPVIDLADNVAVDGNFHPKWNPSASRFPLAPGAGGPATTVKWIWRKVSYTGPCKGWWTTKTRKSVEEWAAVWKQNAPTLPPLGAA